MKKILIPSLLFVLSFAGQAHADQDRVTLKSIACQGATLEMLLTVEQESFQGSAATVTWRVLDTMTGKSLQFMGYLISTSGLKEFSSIDQDSAVEVSGSVAVLNVGEKEEALLCKIM